MFYTLRPLGVRSNQKGCGQLTRARARLFPFLQNSFYALYRSFTECCFIEDEGSIVFYKNKHGDAQRVLAEGAVAEIKNAGWSQEKQDQLAHGALSDSVESCTRPARTGVSF